MTAFDRRRFLATATTALLALSASAALAQNRTATITGPLSYPSDHIPQDMRICAESLSTRQAFCTTRKTKRGRSTRYELKLPPDSYFVYATTAEWSGPPAYYSEFVTCGLDIKCPSHKPIAVAVKAGERRDDVHPGDWYAK